MTTLQTVLKQANWDIPVNENFTAVAPAGLFALKATTTTGLTLGYYGGILDGVSYSDGTHALTASTTRYVVVARATGVVSSATGTTNWNDSTNYMRMGIATVATSTFTWVDWRQFGSGGGGGGSGTVTSVAMTVPGVLSVAGSPITTTGTLAVTGVDPGADRIVFWDDSATDLAYLTVGSGLSISGTTLTATGGSTSQAIPIACSDETTALTTGTAKVTFRMPYAFTLTAVRASLTTAQTAGSIFTVDINEGGTTILSTKITIDNNEKTSTTAAAPPVISDTTLADDAEITIDIDQIGTSGATGLKVYLIGTP